MKDQIISLETLFNAIACWLTLGLLLSGSLAVGFFQLGLAEILNKTIGAQSASGVAACVVVGCWFVFVVTALWVLAAALIYVWQPKRFWEKCHSINLSLVAFAMVWLGMQTADLLPAAIAAVIGLMLGALLVRFNAHLWKGSQVGLIVVAAFSGLVQSPVIGAKSYVLPLVGAISIAITASLWILSRPKVSRPTEPREESKGPGSN